MTPPRPPAPLPRLLLLTDRAQLRLGRGLVTTVAECVEAGLTHVVLRELDLADERREALAEALAGTGAAVIAAHRPLAAAVGVQLPSDAGCNAVSDPGCNAVSADPPRCCSTAEVPPTPRYSGWWGRSCHTRAEVAAAAVAGAAYATLGPFAPTASKPGYGPALPPEELAGHPIPVYALGGVTPANAGSLLAAGAHGVAVMGAVMRAAAPGAVVRDLLAATRTPHPTSGHISGRTTA